MKKINEKKENGRESEKEMEVREKGENEGEKGERKENGGESEKEMEVREKGENEGEKGERKKRMEGRVRRKWR